MENAKVLSRVQMLESIAAQFDTSAQSFCEDTLGLHCDIESQYKALRKPESLKEKRAKIYYPAFVIEFVYTAHGSMGVVNSILSCNVYPDKAEDTVGIPLPLFADYCGIDVKEPLCIPFITSRQGMIQAFQCIGSVAKRLLPSISEMCSNTEALIRLQNQFRDELRGVFRIDLGTMATAQQRRLLSNFFISRFSGGAFLTALRGDFSKASGQLEKAKALTGYEKRMKRLWRQRNLSIPKHAVFTNAKAFSGNGTSKMELQEILSAFVGWLVLCPVCSVAYLGLYALFVWFQGRDSVFLAGPQYNFPYCFLAGFITAIAFSWFTRFFFFKLLFRKDYGQYREMEDILNLELLNKLMRSLGILVVVSSVVFCLLVSNWNLNFKQEGFTDNTTFLSLTGEYHGYSEVEYVYYKPDRVNGYGETIARPSYVIVLKDGREIDFHGYSSTTDVSQTLIPFFHDQGIPVR